MTTTKKTQKSTGNKRSREKYPYLKKEVNLRLRQEKIDYDYIHKLNDEEKAWLDKFTAEWVGATYKNDGTDMHKTKEERKLCNLNNNANNRDVISRQRASKTPPYSLNADLKNVSTKGDIEKIERSIDETLEIREKFRISRGQ